MRRREDFEDAPKGKVTILDDFLPPPSQLVRKEYTTKCIQLQRTPLSCVHAS